MTDWLNAFVIGDNGGDCVFSLLPDLNNDPSCIRRRRFVCVCHSLNFHIDLYLFHMNYCLTPTVSVQDRSGPVWTRSAGWRWGGGGRWEAKFSRTGATKLQRSDQKVLSSLSRPGPGENLNQISCWALGLQLLMVKYQKFTQKLTLTCLCSAEHR